MRRLRPNRVAPSESRPWNVELRAAAAPRARTATLCGLAALSVLALGCRSGTGTARPEAVRSADSTFARTVERIDGDLGRWGGFGFSGAVLVARGERVLLSRGYGLANRATGAVVTPETQFDIGSLSKQFTAAAILALADEGRLDLQGSISQVLPDVPPNKEPMTIHHLLTHTSGISDFGSDAEVVSRDELVRQILAAPLWQAPGGEYEYSNLGYTLLAAIVELASGARFEDYLAARLFEPAGLRHTTLAWAAPNLEPDRLALGYGGFADPVEGEDPREGTATWRSRGSGGVLSTTEDLLRWHRALQEGRVLSTAAREAMFTPHTTAEADFLSYGYGWRMQSTADGKRLIWHSGLEGAFSTMFRHYVDDDVVLIFLSNLSIGGRPMREVLVPPSRSGPPASELFAEALAAAPAYVEDDARLAAYEGRYRVGEAANWVAEIDASALVLRAEGQEALDALFPPENATRPLAYEQANQEAVRMARCLFDASCPGADTERIDPLGYARRDASAIAESWRRRSAELGALQEVRALGTTAMRGRRPEQMVTQVRLLFAHGAVDEHMIWYADDEIYWIAGRPETFAVPFKPATGAGLVGFDLLTRTEYRAELSDGDDVLTVATGEQAVPGRREAWTGSSAADRQAPPGP